MSMGMNSILPRKWISLNERNKSAKKNAVLENRAAAIVSMNLIHTRTLQL